MQRYLIKIVFVIQSNIKANHSMDHSFVSNLIQIKIKKEKTFGFFQKWWGLGKWFVHCSKKKYPSYDSITN